MPFGSSDDFDNQQIIIERLKKLLSIKNEAISTAVAYFNNNKPEGELNTINVLLKIALLVNVESLDSEKKK